MATIAQWKQPTPKTGPLEPLREGDRLSQPEFHRRYEASPEGIKAEPH